MTSPLFSIVIPTYNRAELVRQAVVSVLRQTMHDFEVVVSDNLSTDETLETINAIDDPRVRCIRPPRHMVLPDHWEFARQNAAGRLVMMLSDDDALTVTALERFAAEHRRYDADFLFCRQAEYRDQAFPGSLANSLTVPAFKGQCVIVDPAVFVGRQMAFRSKYNMHPSGFVFSSELANTVAGRNSGRFFQTLGVEYFAWPIAAVVSRCMVYIDYPLVIIGRTAKSWGTNMVLLNPGEQKIEQFVDDAQTERIHTPLTNYTLTNLILEGLLTSKARFPDALAEFDVDMSGFVRATRDELEQRRAQGIDVSGDLQELDEYVARNPELLPPANGTSARNFFARARDARKRARRLQLRIMRRAPVTHASMSLEGDRDGFADALTASTVLSTCIDQLMSEPDTARERRVKRLAS
jgi:hypothetical protein